MENKIITDIEGTELKVGDEVYYARVQYRRGKLIKCIILKLNPTGSVSMKGGYLAKRPSSQLIKVK